MPFQKTIYKGRLKGKKFIPRLLSHEILRRMNDVVDLYYS